MASDEYLWELMMQEAASGALGFEYLNDEPAFVSTSIQNDTPAVPSVGDSINDCKYSILAALCLQCFKLSFIVCSKIN